MISALRLRHQAIRRKLRLLFSRPGRAPRLRLHCSLRTPEYRRVHRHARLAGKPPTAFLREAALAYLERRYLVPARIEDRLQELVFLFRNIAGNLNQLAAKANALKRATVFDLLFARRLVLRLEEAVKDFLRRPPEDPAPPGRQSRGSPSP